MPGTMFFIVFLHLPPAHCSLSTLESDGGARTATEFDHLQLNHERC